MRRSHPAGELNALADSMIAIAVDYTERRDPKARAIIDAVQNVLVSAGSWRHPSGGTPYAGASERLVRLAYELQGRWGTLGTLARLPNRAEGLRHVREFAMSTDFATAQHAITILDSDVLGGTEGLEILRELYVMDRVREPHAREVLEAKGRALGWTRR
jgi:hypothetical protein